MNKTKTHFFTIIAFCFALMALCIGFAVAALSPAVGASAASTYAPSSLFWGMTGGEVRAYSLSDADTEGDKPVGYVTLLFADADHKEGSVEYQKNLALKWFNPVDEGAEEVHRLKTEQTPQYFSMTFALPQVNFDTFTLTLSGTEENVTKDGKSVNEIVFKNDNGTVYAYVKDSSLQGDDNKDYKPAESDRYTVDTASDIKISIDEVNCNAGEFNLKINDTAPEGAEHSKLTNIGGYFMERRTSSPANVPLTFKVVMKEGATTGQKVALKSFNGQTMQVTGGTVGEADDDYDDGTKLYEGGNVEDNAAPALVINQTVYAFTLGQKFQLDYEVIDVCNSSVNPYRYYYFAKKNDDGEWVTPKLSETQDKDGYQQLSSSNYFLPTQETEDTDVKEYISIRFTANDGRTGADKQYYYLTWYADKDSVKDNLDQGMDYILVDRAKEAPYYTVIKPEERNVEGVLTRKNWIDDQDKYDKVVSNYQTELNDAAKKVSAGDGAYFYLPSLRDLISSNYADYRNLRFNIYYCKPGVAEGSSASSETSLRYNNLRFEIDEPGTYKFRIMAADAAGNTMQMYIDEGDGNMKLTTLTSTNIWDVEEIPDFTVEIDYTGAVIEPMESQVIGYRGTSYSISNFDIIAYGNSTRNYTLYYLDDALVREKSLSAVSIDDLVADAAAYLSEDGDKYESYHECFRAINKFNSDITEEDEELWEKSDNAYNWNPGTTPGSFTPQKSGLYVVELELVDSYLPQKTTKAYQAIDIRNPVDVTPQQIDWLRNNVTSVVLFAISAVLAVAIVVLFVVKPSEKNVEEVDLDKLKGKKNKNEKK